MHACLIPVKIYSTIPLSKRRRIIRRKATESCETSLRVFRAAFFIPDPYLAHKCGGKNGDALWWCAELYIEG
jgi:hypothetical protein